MKHENIIKYRTIYAFLNAFVFTLSHFISLHQNHLRCILMNEIHKHTTINHFKNITGYSYSSNTNTKTIHIHTAYIQNSTMTWYPVKLVNDGIKIPIQRIWKINELLLLLLCVSFFLSGHKSKLSPKIFLMIPCNSHRERAHYRKFVASSGLTCSIYVNRCALLHSTWNPAEFRYSMHETYKRKTKKNNKTNEGEEEVTDKVSLGNVTLGNTTSLLRSCETFYDFTRIFYSPKTFRVDQLT